MRNYKLYTILDEKDAVGEGKTIQVKDFRHLVISVATADNANLTVKAVGSIQEIAPDFSAAQSVTNMYDYIELVDLQNGDKVTGDTGLIFSGIDGFRMFEVNVNGIEWLNFKVTARSAGKITVKLLAINE